MSYLRVPLGASDFSASGTSRMHDRPCEHRLIAPCAPVYSFDDVSGDTSLSSFNINKAPAAVFSVINDIKGINPYLKVHLLPWSPVRRLQILFVTVDHISPFIAGLDEG